MYIKGVGGGVKISIKICIRYTNKNVHKKQKLCMHKKCTCIMYKKCTQKCTYRRI